jgi:alkylated DNA repair dioxygenase AlkB
VSDQPTLFDDNVPSEGANHITALDIEDADVVLFERCFSRSESDRLFDHLLAEASWRQETVRFYGREHPIPRLTAWHGDRGRSYTYSGISMRSEPWSTALLEIKHRIEVLSDTTFNSVLLNLYRDGNDSVSWHSDDEPELGPEPVIGSVSLGATRRFAMRHKERDDLRARFDLGHGSYLLMRGQTQRHWEHQVPKTSRPVGKRINLTFRRVGR